MTAIDYELGLLLVAVVLVLAAVPRRTKSVSGTTEAPVQGSAGVVLQSWTAQPEVAETPAEDPSSHEMPRPGLRAGRGSI